jgi:acetylornithine deacetylase/succinyl-diaminopimelate desuccinylase-like protein
VPTLNPLDLITEKRVVELTKELVSIPSTTGNEDEMVEWLEDFFKSLHLENIKRLPVEEAGDTIYAELPGKEENPCMMLNFHIDTFDAFEGWSTPPFEPLEKGNRIYGLGAHDMKGGMACALAALEALVKSSYELKGKLIVTGTSDEEYWSRGVHELIKAGLLESCDYCLVPEPADHGTLIIGQRGRHVIKIRFKGSSVSAAYDEGINALVDASKIVVGLEKLKPDKLGYLPQYNMRGNLCVIGFHSGGEKIYVPELAEVIIDRHILPGQDVESAVEQIRNLIEDEEIKSNYEISWDKRPTPAPTSFITDPESKFVNTSTKNLETEIGEKIELTLARSVADTNHIAVHGGVPTIIMGPSGGNTCEANEWVDKDSLVSITRAISRTIMDMIGF